MTLPQSIFGGGTGWITPVQDAFGTVAVNPSPILVSAWQDVSIDMSADVKEMYGTGAFAIAIGRGKQKMSFKVKNGQVHGRLWNQLFFGQTTTAGIYTAVQDVTGIAIPTTPFTVTVSATAGDATHVQIPNSGTYGYNLGVRDANYLPFARVASGPTTRQYSLSGGVYTFATADSGTVVYIDYNYTATSTVAQKLVIANVTMGAAPIFQFDMHFPYLGNSFDATFPTCMTTKAAIATKLDDFTYPEFDITAFAPGGAGVGTLSWSQ